MSLDCLKKLNCWEFMNCGREPGGARVDELGECPVPTAWVFNGINGGKNGGRICWLVPLTTVVGETRGTFTSKLITCIRCPFFQRVKKEEGAFSFPFGFEELKEESK